MKLRHVREVGGSILAPWFYWIGRALPKSKLIDLAVQLDPYNLRPVEFSLSSKSKRRLTRDFRLASLFAAKIEKHLGEELRKLLSISESQYLQDVFVALTYSQKRNGYFVEVGVGYGREISNTYMLEKHFGWSGLLVEPNKASRESILACRSADLDVRAAAFEGGDIVQFQEIVGQGEHSRIFSTGVGHELKNAETVTYDVTTVSLTELFIENKTPTQLDFLSLDTEGGEAEILKGLDWKRYHIGIIAVEHNCDASTQAELDGILLPLGYRKVLTEISAVDGWYVHSSVKPDGCNW